MRRIATTVAAVLTAAVLAPPPAFAAGETTTTVTPTVVKLVYGDSVGATITVTGDTGTPAGSLEVVVTDREGTLIHASTIAVAAGVATTSVAFGTPRPQTYDIDSKFTPTDLGTWYSSGGGADFRVERDTTTASTKIPSVKKGSKAVGTTIVTSTRGMPTSGELRWYLVDADDRILKTKTKTFTNGTARVNLGKLPVGRYLYVTRTAQNNEMFKQSNTVESRFRVKRR